MADSDDVEKRIAEVYASRSNEQLRGSYDRWARTYERDL